MQNKQFFYTFCSCGKWIGETSIVSLTFYRQFHLKSCLNLDRTEKQNVLKAEFKLNKDLGILNKVNFICLQELFVGASKHNYKATFKFNSKQ